jgi:hypothetical protein
MKKHKLMDINGESGKKEKNIINSYVESNNGRYMD